MGRPEECARLLLEGNPPSAIARQLRINYSSVIQYLYVAVGKGSLRFSDVVFSIPQETRSAIDGLIAELATDDLYMVSREADARQIDVDQNDLRTYLRLRRAIIGDLYFFVTDLEKNLHTLIEGILKREYGRGEQGWWRLGIPEKVRVDCVQRKERDVDPTDHAYCYTDFIHLKQIIEENWPLFSKHLPKDEAKDKRALMKALVDANAVRNRVMHPVRGYTPSDEDFEFIRELHDRLEKPKWRIPDDKPNTGSYA
ncbi:MAG: Swt1 family HEPN domain-containing protein [Acidobacteriota bacterium]